VVQTGIKKIKIIYNNRLNRATTLAYRALPFRHLPRPP
jgi:hypothetical protein